MAKITILIRKMKKSDMKQVQDIATKAWHATYEGIIPREIQNRFLKSAYSDTRMKDRLKQPYFFVSEVGGKVVGFAQFTEPDQKGITDLVAIYLYPEYQGKGIGTAFLEEGIKRLENVKEIHLNVEKDNHLGRRFYEAKGFSVIAEYEEDFAGHVLNTMQMALKV